MGTRADFYVGRGKGAEWLGSIAWDGYPSSFEPILKQVTEKGFRAKVEEELSGRDDATRPADGWPWPWSDSATTDFAYAFDDGKAYIALGYAWVTLAEYEAIDWDKTPDGPKRKRPEFPDMSDRKNVTLGKRSGLLVVGAKP